MACVTHRALALGAVLFGLASLPACASKPTVSLHHAEIAGASFQGLSLAVFLQVNNDNGYDVMIRSVRAQVTVAGHYTLNPLEFSPNQWLGAKQNTLLMVPLSIPWQLVPSLIAESASSSTIAYNVRGSADVTATRLLAVQRNDYPVDENGSIPRDALIAAARGMIPIPF